MAADRTRGQAGGASTGGIAWGAGTELETPGAGVVEALAVATAGDRRRFPGTARAATVALAAVVALSVAVSVGVVVSHRTGRARTVGNPAHGGAHGLSVDPWRYVPPSARGVLFADVARLRSSPRVGRFFTGATAGCEQVLARGVRAMVLVVPRFPVDEFAVAAVGDLPRDALIACAASRGGGRNEVVHETYRGFDLVRVVARRDGSAPDTLRPPAGAEVVYLPNGVVLAGGGELVRRMVDEGLADAAGAGADPLAGLGALRRRVAGARTVQAAGWMPDDRGTDPIEEHVTGLSVGMDVDDLLDGEAVLACDSPAGADATAQALERARNGASGQVVLPAVRTLLEGAAIAPRGSEVRVRFSLGAQALDGILADADGLLRGGSEGRTDVQVPVPVPVPVR